jgi:Domain of unknown function (DUF4129)
MVATSEPVAQDPAATPGLIAVVGVVVLGVLAAAFGGGWQITPRLGLWEGSQRAEPPNLPAPPPEPTMPPPPPAYLGIWISVLFALMAGAFVAALAWMLWVRFGGVRRRRRTAELVTAAPPGTVEHGPDLPTLMRGAEQAEALLDQPGEPKDAIIRSWMALEDAAARAGAARRPADSPTEFTLTVLSATEADPDAVDGLLHLYHLARFSRHEIGMAEIVEARRCVRGLATSWARFDRALRATVPGP